MRVFVCQFGHAILLPKFSAREERLLFRFIGVLMHPVSSIFRLACSFILQFPLKIHQQHSPQLAARRRKEPQ
jgi:hypothetical protein